MQFLKDFLFPKTCVGCGAIGSFICLRCQRGLVFLEKQRCFYCKTPSLHGFTHPGCKKKFGVDGVISLYIYTGFLKRLLKTAKYRLAKDALNELLILSIPRIGDLLYSRVSPFRSLHLQPIPLHSSKMRKRGFNQAEQICRLLEKVGRNVVVLDVLTRTKNTVSQAQLKSSKARHLNMVGAFLTKSTSIPQKVLLVDDVVTTGSTVRSATEVLKRSNVGQVYVFSLARG